MPRDRASGRAAVVAEYEDRARSGPSIIGRDGLAALLRDAEARAFDVVIVEALDRLSRDMADLAGIHRRLSFLGIEIQAAHEGVADTAMIGLRGLVGQLFREDGAKKVRRGMAGVVREGRYAGGRAYGYRPTPGEPGRLRIDPQEAAVVRRIFEEYAAGRTPRDIAHDLNRDGVPAPRGAVWNASTINGNRERTNGIIQNPIYGGEIVWNRIKMVKDPATGRRVARPNPESEWQRREAPELRLVSEETLATALARKTQRAVRKEPPGPRRYARSVLSGLLKCAACGSGMSKHDNSGGRPRIRCSRATEPGSCANRRSYYLDRIEAGVIEALREELDQPELLAEFVRAYHEEQQRLSGQQAHGRAKAETRLVEVRRQLERLVDAIAAGGAAFEAVRGKMEALEQERRALEARLTEAPEASAPIMLHPQAVTRFRQALADLAGAVQSDRPLAHEAFRELVDQVIVHPAPKGEEPKIKIVGKLAALLDLRGLGSPVKNAVGGLLVAEEGFEPPTQGL
ncbi:recombinase family protein [Methylocystis sp. JR02]|uniref:recombinase family protein n=1 Tax=Methylocystis sp. JR02 TaxID=3046284 RepID=UPI0024B8872B|nr:recombinase family protein [Methylocystis sp. JR02]MDJ0447107.1 recombinase family protein [Methylocystis sp. JR02]